MTRHSNDERHTYSLWLFHETPRALLVGTEKGDRENDKAFWLPKSQCSVISEFASKDGEWVVIEVPQWLAEEKGLDPSLHSHDDGGSEGLVE